MQKASLPLFPAALWLVLGVVVAAALAPAAQARQPEVNPGMWIVELEDAPTVMFEGGTRMELTASGARSAKAFEPTAPSVTGARRLDPDAVAVKRYMDYLDAERAVVLDSARRALGVEIEPRHVYRHVANGFAAELSPDMAAALEAIPGVRAVHPDYIETLHTDVGPAWVRAEQVWTGSTGAPNPTRGEGVVVGVIDTGINWESVFFDPDSPFIDAGSPGAVAISNPRDGFFGLCNSGDADIPCSDKLIGVYDFTDEDSSGFDTDGHGSHTAATAIGMPLSFALDLDGNSTPFSTSGVAPGASFIAYKACQAPDNEEEGTFECSNSATSAALEQAIEDEVDVISYSIGGDAFDPWSFAGNQRRFLNVRAAGITPVVSAGNSGPGEGSVGSPANTPWVVAVANANHGRLLANQVTGASGGSFALGTLTGEGSGSTTSRAIVHARDFGSALCGAGEAELGPECGDNNGASNPFSPGTFDGEIVVCDRGVYGRVEKGRNLELAGAGGMILANTEEQGESTNNDRHCLPATHIGADDGDRIRDWLDSGSSHRGRLSGTTRVVAESVSGRLNPSSSRGPAVGARDLMKPNITAPGTNVLAASTGLDDAGTGPSDDADVQLTFLTGTSMSAPHVAGAAALLQSANSDWGVDEVVSALETTANADRIRRDDDAEARVIDRGAGAVEVDKATRIGLFLPNSEGEFLAANPAGGGDPGALNLPGIFSEGCQVECSFTRRVRALGAGSWTVTTDGALDIEVLPSSFDLEAGEEQQLVVTIAAGSVPIGQWGGGRVVLQPSGSNFVTQRLPVGALMSAGELPDAIDVGASANRGRTELALDSVVELQELVVRTSALVRPERRSPTLAEDPTRNDPYDNPQGTVTELVTVPGEALLLAVETLASASSDIDLFIGRDLNGNGRAEAFEERCASTSPDDLERCEIAQPEAGDWWILVQNWDASNSGSDVAPFEFAVLAGNNNTSLVSFGPGAHPGGPLTLPVFWDQPAMGVNERWVGAVGLATAPDFLANIGVVPVSITRQDENEPADTALFQGRPQTVVVPGQTAHRRLFIDVPPGLASLDIDIEGSLDDVTIRRRDFDALVESVPSTPPAPTTVLAQAEPSGSGWTAGIANPEGGRYFVVLDNDEQAERRVEVTATATRAQSDTPPVPRRGLWTALNRDEDIRQGVEWQIGGGRQFVLWYTYDEAGLPTFYISDAVPDDGSPFFRAELFRTTSNGERYSLNVVGEVQVTAIAEDRFMYAWRLNGNHGAEMFAPINNRSCPSDSLPGAAPTPLLGHWFSPEDIGEGVTLLITDASEAWVRYYYDDANEPRWVIADEELAPTLPDGNRMEVLELRGWCIYCEQVPITQDVVGTLERVFVDSNTVRELANFVAGPPLDSSVNVDRELTGFPARASVRTNEWLP